MAPGLRSIILCLGANAALAACSLQSTSTHQDNPGVAAGLAAPDLYTLTGPMNFTSDYAPVNDDGTVNVVIEIPTGTNAKWEVNKEQGNIQWTFKDEEPRTVNYLGYPGNYGMVPRTLLDKASGGDGDPLDIIVLGPSLPRGSVVSVKLVGVLKLLDGGEQDDKLVAVTAGTSLFEVNNLTELNRDFPGASDILEIWFTHYKGPGKMQSLGFADAQSAREILQAAMTQYSLNNKTLTHAEQSGL